MKSPSMSINQWIHLTISTLVLALIIAWSQPSALAASIIVNSLTDTGTANDRKCELREAINNANADFDTSDGDCVAGSGADVITFSISGTIVLSSPLPVIKSEMTIDGSEQSITVSGNNTVVGHMFDILDKARSVSIIELAIIDGISKDECGAAIRIMSGAHIPQLTLDKVILSGHAYVGSGGGALYNMGANVFVGRSTIMNNSSFSCGSILNEGKMTLQDVFVRGNSTSKQGGGGISNMGSLNVFNSILLANYAVQGGAISNGGSNLTVENTTLEANSASSYGGALFNEGHTTLSGNTFVENYAEVGGGIYHAKGDLHLTNNTLSGNRANASGGAIANVSGKSGNTIAYIYYTTVAANTTKEGGGGGIYASSLYGYDAVVNLTNSIVANNTYEDCAHPDKGAIQSKGYNLDSDGTCNLLNTGDIPHGNAGLLPLADNGGPTWTHALMPISQAIDYANSKDCIKTDQRGITRPQGKNCDIGAYEKMPNQAPVCEAAYAKPGLLWPPNHKMQQIEILGVVDPDGDPVTIGIVSVSQDEPVDSLGDGSDVPDAIILNDTAELRAERMGGGDGRVYHVQFFADDGHEKCKGEVIVGVPQDVNDTPVDGGPLYDSTSTQP